MEFDITAQRAVSCPGGDRGEEHFRKWEQVFP